MKYAHCDHHIGHHRHHDQGSLNEGSLFLAGCEINDGAKREAVPNNAAATTFLPDKKQDWKFMEIEGKLIQEKMFL